MTRLKYSLPFTPYYRRFLGYDLKYAPIVYRLKDTPLIGIFKGINLQIKILDQTELIC